MRGMFHRIGMPRHPKAGPVEKGSAHRPGSLHALRRLPGRMPERGHRGPGMKPFPFNLVIAGVGGQGVATLAKVFWLLASRSDLHCQGSMVKGGAQRLGTVIATLRLFPTQAEDFAEYSPETPAGKLDLL